MLPQTCRKRTGFIDFEFKGIGIFRIWISIVFHYTEVLNDFGASVDM